MPSKPLAFLSYAHIDDEYHSGAITEFRKRLGLAVRVVAGLDFDIFQDRYSIEWGQSWRETLDAALGEVRFLIPILTPSFFRSDECHRELREFLDLEAAARRNDLVLPIYYVTCTVLENETKRREDQLAAAVAKRQYRDWRALRHEPLDSIVVRQALEALALDIDRALHRTVSPPQPTRTPGSDARSRQPRATAADSKAPAPSGAVEANVRATIRDSEFAPELVVVPAGGFMMGSTEPERRWAIAQGSQREWVDWEKPQHRVAIPGSFAVGKHPVTRGQFAAFVEATPHDMSGGCWIWLGGKWEKSSTADWCAPGFDQTDHHPVVGVSWDDAKAYVEWLGTETGQPYRLLSEAEWEYACRAGTTTRYCWGDDPPTPERANFGRNVGETTAVGFYLPNPFGLHDMHGNVWEWVEDCWNESYEGAPKDGSAWTSGDCSRRVRRGGAWFDQPEILRAANRYRGSSDTRNNSAGFRVARTLSRSESITP